MAGVFAMFFRVVHRKISPVVTIFPIHTDEFGIFKKPHRSVASDLFIENDVRVSVIEQAVALREPKQSTDDALLLIPGQRAGFIVELYVSGRVGAIKTITGAGLAEIPRDDCGLGAALAFTDISFRAVEIGRTKTKFVRRRDLIPER